GVRRAGATGNRRALGKRERLVERYERASGREQVRRVPAVGARAHHPRAAQAHLRIAHPTVLAHAAAPVVMDDHALADWRLLLRDACAAFEHHPAWLVASDEAAAALAIWRQIAAAHARRADADYDLTRPRRWIGKFLERNLAVSDKHQAL